MVPLDLNEYVIPYVVEDLTEKSDVVVNMNGKVDKNGWVELEDGRYYNALINTFSTRNPTKKAVNPK
jgi:hypothetical protein